MRKFYLDYRDKETGEFIPIAESTGLILPIGEWVLRTACAQARAWQDAGFRSVRMAVNVSPYQLWQPSWTQTVTRILVETGLAPPQLELEITRPAHDRTAPVSPLDGPNYPRERDRACTGLSWPHTPEAA